MNNLIVVPDYTPNTVNYIEAVNFFVNGIHVITKHQPIIPAFKDYKISGQYRLKINKFYSKFIFRNTIGNIWYGLERECITYDPLTCLNYIMDKYERLKFNKFIEKNEDYFLGTNIVESQVNSFCIIVQYLKIKEELISYIEQKIGRTKQLKELKNLFCVCNTLSFEEFLDKKSKFLLNIDFSDYVSELNKKVEIKKEKLLK